MTHHLHKQAMLDYAIQTSDRRRGRLGILDGLCKL